MALSDARRLYDIATRQQIFIEGVKLSMVLEFNSVLAELKTELEDLLKRIKYKTLDGMTKAEITKLVVSLRKIQNRIYSRYTEDILKQFEEFTNVNAEVSRRIYVSARIEEDEDEEEVNVSDKEAIDYIQGYKHNDSSVVPMFGIAAAISGSALFSRIVNAPIPANGIFLVPFVKGFATSAQASVENTVRQAWSNGWTVQQTINEITERTQQGTSSVLERVRVQNAAVVNTAMQHIAAMSTAAIQSAVYGRYVWHSVLDSQTTAICRDRNGEVFLYGSGPLPPAHINCRSTIAPYVGKYDPETFYAWIKRQPFKTQEQILGKKLAEQLEREELQAKDMPKYQAQNPLSINEYRKSVSDILAR